MVLKLRQSDQECYDESNHHSIERYFEERHEFMSLKDSVANCSKIDLPGIDLYKQIGMNEKYNEVFVLLTCRMMCCINHQLKAKIQSERKENMKISGRARNRRR